MKEQLLIAYTSLVPLILWKISYKIGCISLIIPILISVILFINTFNFKKNIKICIANCYLNKNSFIYKLFTSPIYITVSSFIVSLILTFSLSLYVIFSNFTDLVILTIDILILILIFNFVETNELLNEKIKSIFSKEFSASLNAFFLTILFFIINLYQTPPSFISNDLILTLKNASNQFSSNCEYLDYIVRLLSEIKAFKWWIMLDITLNLHFKLLNILLWALFLIGNFLSYYAFGRYILELVYQITKAEK